MIVAAIPDTHFPWSDVDKISALYSVLEKEKKIDAIVQLGDLTDSFAFSKFPKCLEMSPEEEMTRARGDAELMWLTIKKICKKATCYQLLGNHDLRPERKAMANAAELHGLVQRTMKEYFTFDGVQTVYDARRELILDNTVYIHGYATRLGAHLNHFQGNFNVVHGHSHRPGLIHRVYYDVNGSAQIKFEMDCGYLADPTKKVLHYTPTKWNNWLAGMGFIRDGVPELILL